MSEEKLYDVRFRKFWRDFLILVTFPSNTVFRSAEYIIECVHSQVWGQWTSDFLFTSPNRGKDPTLKHH